MRFPFIIFLLFLNAFAYAQGLKDPLIKYYEEVSSYQEIDKLKKEIILMRTIEEKGKLYWYIGLNYNNLNHEDSALSYYLKAKDIFKGQPEENDLLLKIHQVISSQERYKAYGRMFLKEYYKNALLLNSPEMLCNANMEFAKEEFDKSDKESISIIRKRHFLRQARKLYLKALEYNSKTDNCVTKGNILQSLGVIEYTKGNFSLSRVFLDRSIVELTKGKSKKYLVYAYYNYAQSYFLEKNYLKSKEWFQKTLDLKIPVYKRKFERHIYERMSESDEHLKNYKAGLNFRKKYDSLNVIINDKEQNIAIHKVQIQNNVKEKDKTISTQKEFIRAGKKYRIVYFIIAVTAFLLALYSFIRWKKIDIKRKRLLSEKQTIEVQHTETLEELQKVKQLIIEDHIILKNKTRIYLSELVYIKSEGHYLEFYTVKKKEFLRGNISEIITQLPPNFVQSHRSYIVNRNYVVSHNTTTVFLKDGYEIPLSRKYKSIFNE